MTRVAVVLFGPREEGGFNECGAAGAERARAFAPGLEVVWCEPPADRAACVRDLARQGYTLIVAHGGQGDAPVAAVAPDFPATAFAVTQGSQPAANVACYDALQEHSAYLAGVLAALQTRSGVVAHMSGERVRPGLKGRAAFADGVARTRPEVRLLTTFCGNQHDADLAYRVVAAQARAGADILFAMIDGGRAGALRAGREFGVRHIGNVFDWTAREPESCIASAVADSGECIVRAVRDHAAGALRTGEVVHVGSESPEVVRLAMGDAVDASTRAAVAAVARQLADGRIQPAIEYTGREFEVAA